MSDEQTTPWKGMIEWVLSLPCVVDEPGARLVYEVMQRLKPQLEQRIAEAVAAERERWVKAADNWATHYKAQGKEAKFLALNHFAAVIRAGTGEKVE